MTGLHLPKWARRAHPIVRYEARHWARSRVWRLARNLLWAGSAILILVPAACALLFALESHFTNPAAAILEMGGVFSIGLALLSSLAVWFSHLSATILGATLIARERESQTWPFLRLTNLTTLDIAGGKFMALFYTLIGPVQLITALRLLALAAGVVTLVSAYLASGLSSREFGDLFGPLFQQSGLTAAQWLSLAAFATLAVLWTTINWLLEPLFGLLYYGLVGLSMSTLARSRGTAIVLVFAAHFCLVLGLYAPASQITSLFLAPLAVAGSQDAIVVLGVLTIAFQFVLQTLLPWAVMAAGAVLTLRRVAVLSD